MAERPLVCSCSTGTSEMLTFPDGVQVGVVNLGTILKEVADLKLGDDAALKRELLRRVKDARNYVVPGAEDEYADVLLKEYRRRFERAAAGR